jgi:hypothetical protein
MTDFLIHEIVRTSSANAYVKNYFSSNGVIVLEGIDPVGSIGPGAVITGDDSGAVMVLNENFVVNYDYDGSIYRFRGWDIIWDQIILAYEDGPMIAVNEHFTDKPSQDYQTTNIVVL